VLLDLKMHHNRSYTPFGCHETNQLTPSKKQKMISHKGKQPCHHHANVTFCTEKMKCNFWTTDCSAPLMHLTMFVDKTHQHFLTEFAHRSDEEHGKSLWA